MAPGPLGPISFSRQQGAAGIRNGQGPSILIVQNTSGAAQTVTIGIVPTVSSGTVRTGIAVQTITGGSVGTARFDANHASTASITITGDQPTARAISFYYVDGKGQSVPTSGQKYTFTMTLTMASTTVVIPGITMDIP